MALISIFAAFFAAPIKSLVPTHGASKPAMPPLSARAPIEPVAPRPPHPSNEPAGASPARLLAIFDAHYDFVWRLLRRLGVADASVDDAAQHVFWIVSQKLAQVESGREASFLYGTARRVASDVRESARLERSRTGELTTEPVAARSEQPDAVLERKRARQLLDRALDELDLDLRAVFVLYELEGLTSAAIAELLDIPLGTAASRLRRARQIMQSKLLDLQERLGGAHD